MVMFLLYQQWGWWTLMLMENKKIDDQGVSAPLPVLGRCVAFLLDLLFGGPLPLSERGSWERHDQVANHLRWDKSNKSTGSSSETCLICTSLGEKTKLNLPPQNKTSTWPDLFFNTKNLHFIYSVTGPLSWARDDYGQDLCRNEKS